MNRKHFTFTLAYALFFSIGCALSLQGDGESPLIEEEIISGDIFEISIQERPPRKLKKSESWVLGHLRVTKTAQKRTRPHQILEIAMSRKDVNFADYGVKRPDFNCDGYPDIEILQHEGAKWGYVHIWLYDPDGDKFHTTEATRQFSKIGQTSYRVDPKTKLIHVKKFQGANLTESTYHINKHGLLTLVK